MDNLGEFEWTVLEASVSPVRAKSIDLESGEAANSSLDFYTGERSRMISLRLSISSKTSDRNL